MMDVEKRLAVQSYCFRAFKSHKEVIEKVKECGLSRVELCGAHVDWKEKGKFDEIVKMYREGGVEICAIGVVGFGWDEKTERNYFEFARKAGCKVMSMDFAVGKMPGCAELAGRLAEEYDMRLGIHNHGARHWLGNSQMLSEVMGKCSERIGLYLDTAWALDSSEDPVGMVEKFGKRLYGLHIKDFVFDRAGNPQDVVVGTGNLKLRELYEALVKVNYAGSLVLEYEGDVNNPVPAVRECVKAVREQMK